MVDKLEPRTEGSGASSNAPPTAVSTATTPCFISLRRSQRLVQTFEYECATSNVSMESMTLEERNGRTVVTAHSLFQSVEDREGMLAGGGKEEGARETYAKLEELLAKD